MSLKYAYKILIGALLALVTLGACSSDEDPVPVPDEVKRTVLIYMQANNSLGSMYQDAGCDYSDLQEIQAVASKGFGNARVIIYHQPRWNLGNAILKEATAKGFITLKEYDNSEFSVSEARMTEVIKDMKQWAPAEKYGLVLWSHASGWWNDGVDEAASSGNLKSNPVAPLSFGIDSPSDDSRYTMSINSLAKVLRDRTFDYIYFDCCFMASVEVAYQLRNSTDMIVASAAELPANGMPYHLTLPYLTAERPDLIKVAETVFNYYNDAYLPFDAPGFRDPDSNGCTISVISTSGLDHIAESMRNIYASGASLSASAKVQDFAPRTAPGNYCDILDYVSQCHGVSPQDMTQFYSALENAVKYANATEGIKMLNSFYVNSHCGLTVFVPALSDPAKTHNYEALDWYKDVL